MTSINVRYKDILGRTRSKTVILEGAVAPEDIQAAYTAWETDFHAASGAAIVKASASLDLTINVTSADAGSNVDEGATIQLQMADGGVYSDHLPCPAKTTGAWDFITATGAVNTADTQVTDYYANFQSAGSFRFGELSQREVVSILSGQLDRR